MYAVQGAVGRLSDHQLVVVEGADHGDPEPSVQVVESRLDCGDQRGELCCLFVEERLCDADAEQYAEGAVLLLAVLGHLPPRWTAFVGHDVIVGAGAGGPPPAPGSRVGYFLVPNSFAHLVVKKVW